MGLQLRGKFFSESLKLIGVSITVFALLVQPLAMTVSAAPLTEDVATNETVLPVENEKAADTTGETSTDPTVVKENPIETEDVAKEDAVPKTNSKQKVNKSAFSTLAIEENAVCDTGCEYDNVADAVEGEDAGSTITIKANFTENITSTILVNKQLTITGETGAEITTEGSNHVFVTTAAGVTINNLQFTKNDKANQNMINVQGANTTISNNDFNGQYLLVENDHTSRALEISTTTGLSVTGNTFNNLRQPAYINDNTTGSITDNYVHETRGWVAIANTDLEFDGNTFGTNAVDIAFLAGSPNNYSCSRMAMITANNDNATIDNQAQTRACTPPPAASTVIVRPSNTQGWMTSDTRANGHVDYVSDTGAPLGTGALSLKTDTNPLPAQDKAQYYAYPYYFSPIYLSDVTGALGYHTKQNDASFSAGLPAYQIPVLLQNTAGIDTFATLTYEPYVDKGNAAVQNGVWQEWNINRTSSKFYVSQDVSNVNGSVVKSQGSSTYTLDEINEIFPDAKVLGYGVNIGTNNPGYDTETDAFTFNNTTFNFEQDDTTPPVVDAGTDKTVDGNKSTVLNGSCENDDCETYSWSKVSGPGNVNFANAAAESTNVSVTEYGTYVLKLSVTDEAGNPASDTVTVKFNAPNSNTDDEEDEESPASQGSGGGSMQPTSASLTATNPFALTYAGPVNNGTTDTVLGDSDSNGNDSDDEGDILATNLSDEDKSKGDVRAATDDKSDDGCFEIFGICWYWWLAVIALVVAILSYIYARRRRMQAEDSAL